MPTLAEVVSVFDAAYDPRWAESWDAVGLVCGDPDAAVRRVLFAVDPAGPVVDEALAWGADLLVTHHPLLLKPVHGVAATSFKGRAVHRLISHGTALLTAHTNADVAAPGVSDALARALGLDVIGPILPSPSLPSPGQQSPGQQSPGQQSPGQQSPGQQTGPQYALRGLGRFGALPEATSLRSFAARVAAALPATGAGVRVSGDPDRPVRLVAVCGGAGDDRALLAAVRAAGADAYVTADLRHHPALEAREAGEFGSPDGGPALVDVAHWASEWPWLGEAARLLAGALGAGGGPAGDNLEIRVSALVTDPWSLHLPQKHSDVLE